MAPCALRTHPHTGGGRAPHHAWRACKPTPPPRHQHRPPVNATSMQARARRCCLVGLGVWALGPAQVSSLCRQRAAELLPGISGSFPPFLPCDMKQNTHHAGAAVPGQQRRALWGCGLGDLAQDVQAELHMQGGGADQIRARCLSQIQKDHASTALGYIWQTFL